MLLQDFIEYKLINAYKWDKSVPKNKAKIKFSQIKLTEMYQKINDQAEAKATANATAFSFLDKDKKKNFYSFHEGNIMVCKDPDNKDQYNLICGLISYKTLEKVFSEKKRKYERRAAADPQLEKWREPTVLVLLLGYPSRADFVGSLKQQYELTLKTDPGYLKIDDKQEYDPEKVKDEMIRLSEDSSYSKPIEALQIGDALYPVTNIEYAAAVKKYNESVDDKNKIETVYVTIKTEE